MQVENTPSLARKKSKVHEDDLVSSFSDCTSGTYPNSFKVDSYRSTLRPLGSGDTLRETLQTQRVERNDFKTLN